MTLNSIDFSEEDKIKILLWCDRHCCLCDKQCSTNIIIHHIEQEGSNLSDIDNAIPLCLECHGKIRSYDPKHPVGTKYKVKEIKTRRDQIYERYTMPLVPPIHYELQNIYYQNKDENKPKTHFWIENLGNSYPAKVKVEITAYLGNKKVGIIKIPRRPYYSGDLIWYLNPRSHFQGNFNLQKEWLNSSEILILEIQLTIIDIYDRPHKLLPICYRHASIIEGHIWNPEPTSFNELKKYLHTQ